jgi:hypothetical protein
MVTPAVKHNIVKKRTAHFKRHQSNRFMRVGVRIIWYHCMSIEPNSGIIFAKFIGILEKAQGYRL